MAKRDSSTQAVDRTSEGPMIEKSAKSTTDTLLVRFSERLGHPILAAYLILFCTREWPFLLGIYKAFFGPSPTVPETRPDMPAFQLAMEQASRFFNWWDAVAINLLLAVLVAGLMPFIDRLLNRYTIWHEKKKKVETEQSVESIPLTRQQIRASSLYLEASATQAAMAQWVLAMGKSIHSLGDQGSTYVLCTAKHSGLVLHHFVRAVSTDGSEILRSFPLDGFQRDSIVVYVVDQLIVDGERYLLCAKNNSLVPTPPGHSTGYFLGSDPTGHLVAVDKGRGGKVIHLEPDMKVQGYLRIRADLDETLPEQVQPKVVLAEDAEV